MKRIFFFMKEPIPLAGSAAPKGRSMKGLDRLVISSDEQDICTDIVLA
jgi:hypothetical protein